MLRKLILMLIPCLFMLNAYASEQQLEIFTLQHRSAADVVPVIQPFLTTDDTLSSDQNKLFIRASEKQIEAIRRIIHELDTPAKEPRRLMITVKQLLGNDNKNNRYSTETRDSAVPIQEIQVIEGQPALIDIGQMIPVVSETGSESTKIEHVKVSSGFRAIAEIIGNQVQLNIMPYTTTPGSGGSINLQQSQTTASGPLGEWFLLGGGREKAPAEDRKIHRTHERSQQARQIWVKVTEVQ